MVAKGSRITISPSCARLRYRLHMDGTHAIGLDLGGTKILAGVVTRDGEIVRRHERPTPTDSQDRLLAEVDAAIETLLADDGVAAIGLGIPGTIDQAGGRIYVATNIPLADVGAARPHAGAVRRSRSGSTTTRTPPRSASGRPARRAARPTS